MSLEVKPGVTSPLATLTPYALDLANDPKVVAERARYRKQAAELEIGVAVAFEDKEVLLTQLSHFVLTERQQLLVDALLLHRADPGKPVREILLEIPMTALEFMNILREVRTAFSDFKTKDVINHHRAKVVEAVMKGAMPKTNACVDCEGTGKITVNEEKGTTRLCRPCFGSGKITKEPEHARQITALEVAGVLKKGGPAVEVNVNNSSGDGWRSSPDFRRETDRLMYGTAIDVEVATSAPSSSQALPEAPAADIHLPGASDISIGIPEVTPVVLGEKAEENEKKTAVSYRPRRNMHPKTMKAPVTVIEQKPTLVPKK